jgi:hypothetical protein
MYSKKEIEKENAILEAFIKEHPFPTHENIMKMIKHYEKNHMNWLHDTEVIHYGFNIFSEKYYNEMKMMWENPTSSKIHVECGKRIYEIGESFLGGFGDGGMKDLRMCYYVMFMVLTNSRPSHPAETTFIRQIGMHWSGNVGKWLD